MPCTLPSSPAVERVEHEIGLGLGQLERDVATHVDPGDAMTERLQRVGHAGAGQQRHLSLGRPAAHQDRDVEGFHFTNPTR
jgi:hypothetical protein